MFWYSSLKYLISHWISHCCLHCVTFDAQRLGEQCLMSDDKGDCDLCDIWWCSSVHSHREFLFSFFLVNVKKLERESVIIIISILGGKQEKSLKNLRFFPLFMVHPINTFTEKKNCRRRKILSFSSCDGEVYYSWTFEEKKCYQCTPKSSVQHPTIYYILENDLFHMTRHYSTQTNLLEPATATDNTKNSIKY